MPISSHSFTASAALAFVVLGASGAQAKDCQPVGSSQLLAPMPVTQPFFPPTGPTYPEGIAVLDGRVVVSGPATFGTAGNNSPSQLTIFDADSGALRAEVPLVGEDLTQEHAMSELFAWKKFVYAPSTQLGVVRWEFAGKNDDSPSQESYSTPFCSVTIPFPCLLATDKCPGDIRPGLPPLPNGIVLDKDGEVYVTDSLQGIVWHLPKEHGKKKSLPLAPEVLFCSRALQGSGTSGFELFGANGVAIVKHWIYVAVTFGPFGPTGPTSVIYRMPKNNPQAADLEIAYVYDPVEVAPGVFVPPIADGLRYDESSKRLFVVLGGQNQVSVLDLEPGPAVEVARYSRTVADHPFLNPSTIALDKHGVAFVTNHAITCCLPGDPAPGCVACSNAQTYFGVVQLCTD